MIAEKEKIFSVKQSGVRKYDRQPKFYLVNHEGRPLFQVWGAMASFVGKKILLVTHK